ncbi:hypothetical protein JCM15548_13720 [Geofilum rubicundum JCM 15548]|uniref:Uncharacterized protein n=1 Tax=Geofilum rubicundum JCM 15548 TaxID=1236989 RepID=A0A0E9M0N9_9BACT|nr:hypothetical protein JCM15548_13720 [Geofilum rubicundum JCM 15548]
MRAYGIFLLIIALGLQLKFHSIESKYFWYDEIETIMHTSGIPDKNYDAQFALNEVKNIDFYQDKLRLNTQDYSMYSQITGVFSMPQLTPLHPLLLIFWSKIVGDEFVHYRLFNTFLFFLLLPFLFLLCKTLFKSNESGWIALSLIAVSPFFDIYTKEARYVILWTFFIILNSYFFLKAYENNKKIWWWCYSVSGILLMYASLLSGLLILSQLIVVAIVFKRYYTPFFLSILIITIAYLPWMINIGIHIEEIFQSLQWHKSGQSSSFYTPFIGQFIGFAHVFISFENVIWSYVHIFLTPGGFRFTFDLVLAGIMIILILISFINMLKNGRHVARGIVLSLIIVPLTTFWLYDLIFVGRISFLWRYQVVAFIGILLVVTHFLHYLYTTKNKLFKVIFIVLSLFGIFSIYIVSLNKCYTTLGSCNGWDNFNIAERISHSTGH